MGGTIERLGRLKRLVGMSDETAPYQCHGCRGDFDVQYYVCPDCGSYRVEPIAE